MKAVPEMDAPKKLFKITTNQQKRNKQKPFAAIETETVDSEWWGALTKAEAWVYSILKTFYKGEGKPFKAPFAKIMYRTRIKHGGTIDAAIHGLERKGWIKVARYAKHGRGRGLRVRANEYELTWALDRMRW